MSSLLIRFHSSSAPCLAPMWTVVAVTHSPACMHQLSLVCIPLSCLKLMTADWFHQDIRIFFTWLYVLSDMTGLSLSATMTKASVTVLQSMPDRAFGGMLTFVCFSTGRMPTTARPPTTCSITSPLLYPHSCSQQKRNAPSAKST